MSASLVELEEGSGRLLRRHTPHRIKSVEPK